MERYDHVSGRVLNIQHFCVDDGPGIRTTVFLKGCPLRCVWCHNPETHRMGDEVMFRTSRCIGCGRCVAVCENAAHRFDEEHRHIYDRSLCSLCGRCMNTCLTKAIESVGETMSVEAVMQELLTDQVFYQTSGGGITVSGGEPTAQPEFTFALLSACKENGLHTCIETCCYCDPKILEMLQPAVDLFLVDWKVTDEQKHREYTGVSNKRIEQNLALLSNLGAKVVLRCPLIPQINLEESHYDGIAAIANRYPNVTRIELEPYHPMGLEKLDALGKQAAYRNADFLAASDAEQAEKYIREKVSIPVLVSGK